MYNRKELCLGWAARTLIMTLGMLIGFTIFSSPVSAQTVLPDTDLHGLIAYFNRVNAYSISSEHPDRIGVWTCETPAPAGKKHLRVDPAQLVKQFEAAARSYFTWLSENQYRPEFVEGGTVTAPKDLDCREAVREAATAKFQPGSKKITGVIIVTDTESVTFPRDGTPIVGYATQGILCSQADIRAGSCTWPKNHRSAVIRAHNRSRDHTLIHEIGHMLGFPHSFNDAKPGGEYNNPMDVMSKGRTLYTGTLAVNRYSSGWISADQVKVIPVREGNSQLEDAPYYLEHLGQSELQMLVLPVQKGVFYTLEARVKSGRDSDIPLEGVEVYHIDQFGCDKSSPFYRFYQVCISTNRRTEPFLTVDRSRSDFGQVYREGEVIELKDAAWNTQIWIRVLERTDAGYMVWIGSGPVRSGPLWEGKFLDDEGSVHESSINQLAAAGITRGCDHGLYGRGPYQFCPQDKVTRAQMVAFLGRALDVTVKTDGETPSLGFTDVNLEAEYAKYLNALGLSASDYPGGTFRPNQPITRGETAIMLNRVLSLDANEDRNIVAFADVDESDEPELAKAVANLAAAGITQGCASEPEPLFCPNDPLSRAQMASLLVRSPLDTSSDDDDEEVRPEGRSVRISVGDPSTRCPRGVTCWGLHRDYHYDFSDDFGSPPYTLECWANDQLLWSGDWRGEPTRGCYSWGSGQTVYVVVDGVESNKLLWAQPDDEETQSDGREVRIEVGDPSTRCPQGVNCWGLWRDYHYELIGDFGPAPYTLECWINGSRRWSGIWSGRSTTGCYMWGGGGEIVYVVVDGVKSNELRWAQPDDDEVWPDAGETQSDDEETQLDGRKVRIDWGDDLSSHPDPDISGWCSGYVYCRDFSYELTGFGSGPYTLECWLNGSRRGERVWSGPEYPERGCRVKGNILLVPYVLVDGVKSNELRWPDDEETQPDDEDGRKVRIEWGDDLSSDPDPDISGWCSGYVYCRDFSYELTGLGSGPYTLECWLNGSRRGTWVWSGPEGRGCRVKGNILLVPYVVVDGVSSNELRWPDDEEIQTDGREVRIDWGKDLSSDDPWCSGYVYCRDFSYELTGFGSGPYKLECWLNGSRRDSLTWSGPEERGCRVKGNIRLVPYVRVDGVPSNQLRWSRTGN